MGKGREDVKGGCGGVIFSDAFISDVSWSLGLFLSTV